MRSYCVAITAIFLFSGISTAQDDWHPVTTPDGAMQGLLPGKATDSTMEDKTIAGTVATKIKDYSSDTAQFSISSTKLSRMVQRFANEKTLYDNAKAGVLRKSHGNAKSFEDVTLNDIKGRLLKYEAINHGDENHNGYHGVAFIFVHNGSVYTADVMSEKDSGDADIKRFKDSIRIK
jgi:hypothetical protein